MERNNLTLADIEMIKKIENVNHVLFDIDKMINWERINNIVAAADYRKKNSYGRDCYSPEKMFRVMIIQKIYNFSDRDMESHLRYNLVYMTFCKFSLSDEIPDHTSICRWRNRFVEFNVFEEAFAEINKQLFNLGLEVNNAVIVDATLIKSQARPRKKEIIEVEPTGDDEVIEEPKITITSEQSKDPDARWIKKGKKSTYGYKIHASVNKDGLFNAVITTPANTYDGNMLAEIVNKINPQDNVGLYADKGYDSKKNRDFLTEKNIVENIMRKKNLNQLSEDERVSRNKIISKIRYVVERSFGGLKSKLAMERSKYVGLRKTHNFNILGVIAYNLIRGVNLLKENCVQMA